MENQFHVFHAEPGLRICSYKTNRFKTGRLSFHFLLPLPGDASAYSILPYLLTKSCREYPTYLDLNKRLADLYGAYLGASVTKMGDNLALRITMTTMDNRFTFHGENLLLQCAELLCKCIFAPNAENGAFAETEVAREKRLMLERIQTREDDKRSYALDQAVRIMCAEERYKTDPLGTPEGIAALTPESIYAAWQQAVETATFQLDIVGDTDPAPVADLVQQYTKGIHRTPCGVTPTELIQQVSEVKRVTEQQPVMQSKLVMCFRTDMKDPDKEYAKYRVMTDLFGGNTYSRLFMNVREKQSLCYYCSARFYSQKGIVVVQSGIEAEKAEQAVSEIKKQLQEMADGFVSAEDLEKSHKALRDSFQSVEDAPEDIDGWYFSELLDDPFQTPSELVQQFTSVTTEEVIAAAKTLQLDTVFLLEGTGEEEDA